jgi:hypothetical protein
MELEAVSSVTHRFAKNNWWVHARPLCGPKCTAFTHIKENTPMSRFTLSLTAIAFAAMITAGAAIAQTSTPAVKPAPAASASSQPSTMTQVENWTTKQWEAAKKQWAKDTKKWAGCEQQSDKQKLEGRKSWSFLYKCMTGWEGPLKTAPHSWAETSGACESV